MRLTWLTDVHLNFLDPPGVTAFLRGVAEIPSDALLLSGDIGESNDVVRHLTALGAATGRPVYFVLGNHDFYMSSIAGVRAAVGTLCSARPDLHWLPRARGIPLTAEAGLIGHDGWADGRLGDYWGSDVELSDWGLIADFDGLDRGERLAKLHALGDEAAAHFRAVLPDGLAQFRRVLVLTPVPPLRNPCW